MRLYFPERYNSLERLEYLNRLKRRDELILDAIIKGDLNANNAELEKIISEFTRTYIVKIFNSNNPKSALIEMDNAFEDVCFVLESHGIQRPKDLPIYEFQRKLELIKLHSKPNKKKALTPHKE